MKTGFRSTSGKFGFTLGIGGFALILHSLPTAWSDELEQSIRIHGSKPFGSRVTIHIQLAATEKSIFCRDLAGAPKRRTESIPYPSDLANNHFFFIHDLPRDHCKYRIETLSFELALNPTDIIYGSTPISVHRDSVNPPTGVHLGELTHIGCRGAENPPVTCHERVGGEFRKSGSTPFWIEEDEFKRAAEFIIHFSGR